MLFRDNWIVPTEMGEYYYKKPPVYNWVIIGGFSLFRNYSEYAVRFLSILSFLGMGVLVFLMGRRYVNNHFGIYAGLLTWIMADVLFYFSATAGEIDLFYSFITLASFFTIFHFHQKQNLYALFIATYALGAIGTLTKGLPSPVFLAVSLGVFFLYQGEFRQLFSLSHLAGILTFVLIVGGYFWWYDHYHPFINYFTSEDSLWSQSSERTMLENSFFILLPHLLLFPLETLKNVIPASLLLLFVIRKDFFTELRQQPFIFFCLIIFLSNIAIYWISPGTRSRYVYMLYPLLIIILTFGYTNFSQSTDHLRFRWFHGIILGLIVISGLTCLSLSFIPQLADISGTVAVSIISTLVIAVLLITHLRKRSLALPNLIALIIILRFVFAGIILPYRAQNGSAAQDKADAYEIAQITENESLFLFEDSRCSLTTVFYLERERTEVLRRNTEINSQYYYLANRSLLSDQMYEVFYTFAYGDQEFALIKFRDP